MPRVRYWTEGLFLAEWENTMRAAQRRLFEEPPAWCLAGTAPLASPFAVPATGKPDISVHTYSSDFISAQETSAHPYIKCRQSLWCSGPAVSQKAWEVQRFWRETFPSNASRRAGHCQFKQLWRSCGFTAVTRFVPSLPGGKCTLTGLQQRLC